MKKAAHSLGMKKLFIAAVDFAVSISAHIHGTDLKKIKVDMLSLNKN